MRPITPVGTFVSECGSVEESALRLEPLSGLGAWPSTMNDTDKTTSKRKANRGFISSFDSKQLHAGGPGVLTVDRV